EAQPIQAIRFGKWKAVKNGPNAPVELYNLETDMSESRNLARAEPRLVARAARLMKQARVDDPNWPLTALGRSATGSPRSAVPAK
ncbi:MAG TPA: N-acetylgalactosamine 6-sulfate sulfatase, partial [Verrucomicrobiota bacterium]|nr:N-acetylgalactosamine 6-sulfate sulfatase [Verrucomicrobiota bacterium]